MSKNIGENNSATKVILVDVLIGIIRKLSFGSKLLDVQCIVLVSHPWSFSFLSCVIDHDVKGNSINIRHFQVYDSPNPAGEPLLVSAGFRSRKNGAV